jgi:orotate phosphoribosyltransferase
VTKPATTSFFDLTAGRRGHFQLESGHHSELWFNLDSLFAVPARISPFVNQLSDALRTYDVEMICGPLLGGAFLAQLVAHKLDVEFCFTERVMPRDITGFYQASYLLPPAFSVRVLRNRRIAIVDDVMSAGSALRGTYNELLTRDASPVVAGALMVLGNIGSSFFADRDVPVEAVVSENYLLWLPTECPLCVAGMPLENVSADRTE